MTQHGVSIGISRSGDEFTILFKMIGKLTHEDYEVINPMVDSALQGVENPSIKAMVDLTELEGWDMHAAWDDFQFGLKHGRQFDKIAIYGKAGWQEWAAKIGGWFIAGEVAFFDNETDALDWLR